MLKLSATKLDRMSLIAMQDATDVREEEKTFPNGNQAKYFYLHVRNAGNEFNPYGDAIIKYEDEFELELTSLGYAKLAEVVSGDRFLFHAYKDGDKKDSKWVYDFEIVETTNVVEPKEAQDDGSIQPPTKDITYEQKEADKWDAINWQTRKRIAWGQAMNKAIDLLGNVNDPIKYINDPVKYIEETPDDFMKRAVVIAKTIFPSLLKDEDELELIYNKSIKNEDDDAVPF